MSQLADLAKPFPKEWIKTKPGRGNAEYVEHSVITQRLLEVVGPFDFEVTQVVQSDGDTWCVLARLTAEVDGKPVTIVEGGQSDNKMDPFKSAISDALKRCAMRLGLGLHLWAQENYYLHKKLPVSSASTQGGTEDGGPHVGQSPAINSGPPSVSPAPVSAADTGDGEPAGLPSPPGSPQTSEPEGGDGEASPSGEDAIVGKSNDAVQEPNEPPLPNADLAKLRATFMAIIKGENCKLSYDTEVKPFLEAHYDGRSWSGLTAGEKSALVKALTKGKNGGEKAAAQKAFASKVKSWQKEAAA